MLILMLKHIQNSLIALLLSLWLGFPQYVEAITLADSANSNLTMCWHDQEKVPTLHQGFVDVSAATPEIDLVSLCWGTEGDKAVASFEVVDINHRTFPGKDIFIDLWTADNVRIGAVYTEFSDGYKWVATARGPSVNVGLQVPVKITGNTISVYVPISWVEGSHSCVKASSAIGGMPDGILTPRDSMPKGGPTGMELVCGPTISW